MTDPIPEPSITPIVTYLESQATLLDVTFIPSSKKLLSMTKRAASLGLPPSHYICPCKAAVKGNISPDILCPCPSGILSLKSGSPCYCGLFIPKSHKNL